MSSVPSSTVTYIATVRDKVTHRALWTLGWMVALQHKTQLWGIVCRLSDHVSLEIEVPFKFHPMLRFFDLFHEASGVNCVASLHAVRTTWNFPTLGKASIEPISSTVPLLADMNMLCICGKCRFVANIVRARKEAPASDALSSASLPASHVTDDHAFAVADKASLY